MLLIYKKNFLSVKKNNTFDRKYHPLKFIRSFNTSFESLYVQTPFCSSVSGRSCRAFRL